MYTSQSIIHNTFRKMYNQENRNITLTDFRFMDTATEALSVPHLPQ